MQQANVRDIVVLSLQQAAEQNTGQLSQKLRVDLYKSGDTGPFKFYVQCTAGTELATYIGQVQRQRAVEGRQHQQQRHAGGPAPPTGQISQGV
jgi:hypothetical protein